MGGLFTKVFGRDAGAAPAYHGRVLSGATADTTIAGTGPGVLHVCNVVTAGGTGSTVTFYDGTVAAGTQLTPALPGTTLRDYLLDLRYDHSLHVKVVDSAGTTVLGVSYL